MKETPIIMSGNHPKLILDGLKTQTRRVVNPATSIVGEGRVDWNNFDWEQKTEYDFGDSRYSTESEFVPDELKGQLIGIKKAPPPFVDGNIESYHYQYLHVPYRWEEDATIYRIYPKWDVGDRLWVRETWATESRYDHLKPPDVPDTAKIYFVDRAIHSAGGYSLFTEMGKVRSARFMCKWMCRITLEITEVRVERVQEISPTDCSEEGINRTGDIIIAGKDMRRRFSKLWDSLNAKRKVARNTDMGTIAGKGYSWEENPWVWVLQFREIK